MTSEQSTGGTIRSQTGEIWETFKAFPKLALIGWGIAFFALFVVLGFGAADTMVSTRGTQWSAVFEGLVAFVCGALSVLCKIAADNEVTDA